MTFMPRTVLSLDLSTSRGVIAVVRGEETLFETAFTAERSHNAQVFAPLGEALEVIGDCPAVVVVGTGPGSYTGVRIAIAAAQGVALSRDWPVLGWPSIVTAPKEDCFILGDARRGQYYIAEVKQRLLGPITLMDADAARAQVETETRHGRSWYSFDSKVPLDLPEVQLCTPDAAVLSRIVSALEPESLQALTSLSLEPLYLQEAFITTAKKAGKAVPASGKL